MSRLQGAVRVLCLGNPLRGDDGVGLRVLEGLVAAGLPAGVEAVDGGIGGLSVLDALDGARWGVLVDAGAFGSAPGTVRRVKGDAFAGLEGAGEPLWSHPDLGAVLALGRELGRLPPLVAYLVQVGSVAPGVGLTPPVVRAAASLVSRVAAEARSLAAGLPPAVLSKNKTRVSP